MTLLDTPQAVRRDTEIDVVGRLGRIAGWRPSGDERSASVSHQVKRKIVQSQFNAFFILVYAVAGIGLAFASAAPNQEFGEVGVLVGFVVAMAVLALLNHAGLVQLTTIILALAPTVSLIAAFMQPLPSGAQSLTWTYDAGLFAPAVTIPLVTTVYRPRVAWPLVVGLLLILIFYVGVVMPAAPSLPGLDIDAGIISPHWAIAFQYFWAKWDFLFQPVLILLLTTWIGAMLGRLVRKLLLRSEGDQL